MLGKGEAAEGSRVSWEAMIAADES
jgi:hypothetical protein